MDASCTTSSASAALPNMRYAMPKRRDRHSSNVAASASGSGNGGRPGRGLVGQGRGDRTRVREALAVQAQAGVEPRTQVLECDPGRELDDLGVAEMGPEPSGELVGDLGRRTR